MASKKRSGSPTRSASGSSRTNRASRRGKNARPTTRTTSRSRRSSAGPKKGVEEALRSIKALAERLGASWYLFGAQAAVVWGRARTTMDVDVTFDLPPERIDELLEAAAAVGIDPRVPEAAELARRTYVVPLQTAAGMPIDLILAASHEERAFIERARTVRLAGIDVPCIDPSDLIVTKLVAFRNRDQDDILAILDERPRKWTSITWSEPFAALRRPPISPRSSIDGSSFALGRGDEGSSASA